MKNILITGGAGYIGSHTVKELYNSGYNCYVLDNFSEGHREFVEKYNVFEVDLGDLEAIKKVFKNNKFDAVIHFAAYAYVGESVVNPQKYYYNNVVNTLNLLNAMMENDVKNIIFSSTCATYGEPEYVPIDENHPQKPINPYGRTKLIIENIFKDYQKAYGLNFVVLRYFNAAGASFEAEIGENHRVETHLIPLILKTLTGEKENITIFGDDYDTPDGTCIRDYIHVNDLAVAHKLSLEYLLKNGKSEFINLGSEKGYSVKEIVDIVEKVTGKKVPVILGKRREGDPAKLVATSKKASEILNWRCEIGIEKIIQSAWNWEQK